MRSRPRVGRLLAAIALLAVPGARAAVLCQKRSGAVVLRTTCRRKESVLDPSTVGLVGAKGDRGPTGLPGSGPLGTCPPDSVAVGTTCVDRYEASVWSVPTSNAALVAAVQDGSATAADLAAGGATQVSRASDCTPAFPATFPATGRWTSPLYAASVAGVLPTTCITWFQAGQACALAGKRLVTNEEWQAAAAGTPDDGLSCVTSGVPGPTGTVGCVSRWGAFDLVGNVDEWVSTWGEQATGCTHWSSTFGTDLSCLGGSGLQHLPGAWRRGGSYLLSTPGAFAVRSINDPSASTISLGFRCAR